jgi:hypothetical protein
MNMKELTAQGVIKAQDAAVYREILNDGSI